MSLRCAAALAANLLLAGLASAAEAGGHGEKKEVLDLQAYDLGIWTTVTFLLLLAILWAFAWKPILQGLQKREQSIEGDLESARKAREEAESLRTQREAQLREANQEAARILADARQDAENFKAAERERFKAEQDSERDRLRKEIESARDQALQEVAAEAVNLAALISSKAIRRDMTPDDHRRLLDESLAEMRQNLNGTRAV